MRSLLLVVRTEFRAHPMTLDCYSANTSYSVHLSFPDVPKWIDDGLRSIAESDRILPLARNEMTKIPFAPALKVPFLAIGQNLDLFIIKEDAAREELCLLSSMFWFHFGFAVGWGNGLRDDRGGN
jgi:hypothetical protein